MADVRDFPARGKVIGVKEGLVIFNPANTTYEMHLRVSSPYKGAMNKPIEALIRFTARKIYTVPSGGNFVAPIFGPPKILQGRVRYLDQRSLVIHAGVPVVAQLPAADSALDLESGPIAIGSLVNAVALPGAAFELLQTAAAR
ncbi:MAG TPA: hypothetical protein VMD30_11415 [Tepidisphaeraceae bacterium]|nr:hypothetical protein [Tepidisphaeraceae bacterium]